MPYRKSGKKSGKKKGKHSNNNGLATRILTLKEDMEEYAKIMKTLGDRKMMVVLSDGSERLAIIPGRFRKRCWMTVGDVVLIGQREFQDNKVDILHKYNIDERAQLFKLKEIPDFFMIQEATQSERSEESGFVFTKYDDDDDDDTTNSVQTTTLKDEIVFSDI